MLADAEPQHLVVCGGSALIATGLVPRTTQDVDVVAIFKNSNLANPDPLPETLTNAASTTAKLLSLPENWLNSGPADLFRMGLPEGFLYLLKEFLKNFGASDVAERL